MALGSSYVARSAGDDPWIDWPVKLASKNKKSAPPSRVHRENTAALLDAYGIEVRWNLMRHTLEITIPGFEREAERQENDNLACLLELAQRRGLSAENTVRHLRLLAQSYHPVRDWIEAAAWDGQDRLPELLATIELDPCADPELCGLLVTRWLISCARAVLPSEPGGRKFAPQGVLTLQGDQGIGKTEWFKSLAPPDNEWLSVGRVVDPHNRDSVQQATSFWIVELGELDATFKRADVVALKAFVTQDTDVYRSAFATREERTPRRTVLGASVNPKSFLVDETGNRRWWVVAVKSLDWKHKVDVQQLWAQVMVMAKRGDPWWLDPGETTALSASNRDFEVPDPLVEDLWGAWRPVPVVEVGAPGPRVTLAEIWAALPGRCERPRSRGDANTLVRALREAGVESATKTDGFKTYRVVKKLPITDRGDYGKSWHAKDSL